MFFWPSTQIKRGKIECSFNYKKQRQDGQAFQVNHQAVVTLLAATAEIEALMPHPHAFSALDILAFPGIAQDQEIDKKNIKTLTSVESRTPRNIFCVTSV